jgi:hypothetical protein
LDGQQCEVVGIPDFLIREGDNYVIRDVKLPRRINPDPPCGCYPRSRRRAGVHARFNVFRHLVRQIDFNLCSPGWEDKALKTALDLLGGVEKNGAFPPGASGSLRKP